MGLFKSALAFMAAGLLFSASAIAGPIEYTTDEARPAFQAPVNPPGVKDWVAIRNGTAKKIQLSVNALLRNDNGFECFSAGCSPEGKRGLSIIDVTGKNNVKNVKLKRNGKIVVVRDDNSQDRTVITYTVRDRRTGQTSNVDVVMYFGNRVPKPMRPGHPNAVFVGFQNQPTTLDGDLILNNSHDPDGDPLRLVRVYGGEHGTVQLVNGDVVYTPDPDFVGVDVFSYTIADLDSQGRVKSYAHGNHAVQIIRNPASVS